MANAYNLMDQNIISSLLIQARSNDSFFHPQTLKHSGYAADGYWYSSGVVDTTNKASWCKEDQSVVRGERKDFPNPALVLLADSAIGIYEASNAKFPMWMISLFCDNYAFTDNFNGQNIGFQPKDVQWANGELWVNMQPDLGSTLVSPVIIHFDFAQDKVFLDAAIKIV
jgi:hypothetical protein